MSSSGTVAVSNRGNTTAVARQRASNGLVQGIPVAPLASPVVYQPPGAAAPGSTVEPAPPPPSPAPSSSAASTSSSSGGYPVYGIYQNGQLMATVTNPADVPVLNNQPYTVKLLGYAPAKTNSLQGSVINQLSSTGTPAGQALASQRSSLVSAINSAAPIQVQTGTNPNGTGQYQTMISYTDPTTGQTIYFQNQQSLQAYVQYSTAGHGTPPPMYQSANGLVFAGANAQATAQSYSITNTTATALQNGQFGTFTNGSGTSQNTYTVTINGQQFVFGSRAEAAQQLPGILAGTTPVYQLPGGGPASSNTGLLSSIAAGQGYASGVSSLSQSVVTNSSGLQTVTINGTTYTGTAQQVEAAIDYANGNSTYSSPPVYTVNGQNFLSKAAAQVYLQSSVQQAGAGYFSVQLGSQTVVGTQAQVVQAISNYLNGASVSGYTGQTGGSTIYLDTNSMQAISGANAGPTGAVRAVVESPSFIAQQNQLVQQAQAQAEENFANTLAEQGSAMLPGTIQNLHLIESHTRPVAELSYDINVGAMGGSASPQSLSGIGYKATVTIRKQSSGLLVDAGNDLNVLTGGELYKVLAMAGSSVVVKEVDSFLGTSAKEVSPYVGGASGALVQGLSVLTSGVLSPRDVSYLLNQARNIPVFLNAETYNLQHEMDVTSGATRVGYQAASFFTGVAFEATDYLNPNASYKPLQGSLGLQLGGFGVQLLPIAFTGGILAGDIAPGLEQARLSARVAGFSARSASAAVIGALYGAPSGNPVTVGEDVLLFGGTSAFADVGAGVAGRLGRNIGKFLENFPMAEPRTAASGPSALPAIGAKEANAIAAKYIPEDVSINTLGTENPVARATGVSFTEEEETSLSASLTPGLNVKPSLRFTEGENAFPDFMKPFTKNQEDALAVTNPRPEFAFNEEETFRLQSRNLMKSGVNLSMEDRLFSTGEFDKLLGENLPTPYLAGQFRNTAPPLADILGGEGSDITGLGGAGLPDLSSGVGAPETRLIPDIRPADLTGVSTATEPAFSFSRAAEKLTTADFSFLGANVISPALARKRTRQQPQYTTGYEILGYSAQQAASAPVVNRTRIVSDLLLDPATTVSSMAQVLGTTARSTTVQSRGTKVVGASTAARAELNSLLGTSVGLGNSLGLSSFTGSSSMTSQLQDFLGMGLQIGQTTTVNTQLKEQDVFVTDVAQDPLTDVFFGDGIALIGQESIVSKAKNRPGGVVFSPATVLGKRRTARGKKRKQATVKNPIALNLAESFGGVLEGLW